MLKTFFSRHFHRHPVSTRTQVRHVERMKSRVHQTGRRSNEEHQRYLMIQKKRFEAVVSDSLTGSPLAAGQEEEEEIDTTPETDATTATTVVAG